MTKQKFYELCIKKTFQIACYDENSPYYHIAEQLKLNDDDTFDVILIKLASIGFAENIPQKEQFSVLGWKYIKQVLGFVLQNLDDEELTNGFISMLNSNRSLINLKDKEQDDILYSVIYDNIVGNGYRGSDFSINLVDFYLTSKVKGRYIDKVVSMAYAFGRTNLPLETIIKIKNANPLKMNTSKIEKKNRYGKGRLPNMRT